MMPTLAMASIDQPWNQSWIAAHIPHQGSMCLLNHVVSWDAERLTCVAVSHMDSDNPLRAHDRLGAAAGIEYAAQAMAVHGALRATLSAGNGQLVPDVPKVGFLASVRGATLHVARLDDLQCPLQIEVVCIHSAANTILYQFTVSAHANSQLLLEGRATVIVNAALAGFAPLDK